MSIIFNDNGQNREATQEEIVALETAQQEAQVAIAKIENQIEAKEIARLAIFAKLGLTAEEIAALLS